jgi:hypothetical protein
MSIDHIQFVEYISALAEQGETALVVRQKLSLKDGERQYHADGAPKATFPSFIPATATIKPEQAWYVNTGSFILDRFENGRPAAKAENVEYVLFMMLDDIGTKSKTPLVKPTWIMETSPGSFQWGYVFEEQPSKAEFTAAIKAIADAGYTDPGATNAVRNCRIPGSVNLKKGRNNFPARLVEWHPNTGITLKGFLEAHGIEPAAPDTAQLRSIKLRDTGKDSVVDWMNDHNMVLSGVNAEGWMGIVCPNEASHSDGNPEARYKPLDRSFCCYHGHCQMLGSKEFLQWVHDNGGPQVTQGLREELLAEIHNKTLEKLEPNDIYPNEAKARQLEVEHKQISRLQKADWYKNFAYILSDDTYFELANRRELSRSNFNALFRHVSCISVHTGRKVEASVCFDENREQMGAQVLTGVTYAPGDGLLLARDGEVFGNRWINGRPQLDLSVPVDNKDIQRWLDHCEWLIPDPDELNHCLDVMAYKVQNPAKKINHAILHGSDEGSGKDTMWAPFIWALSGPNHRNRSIVDNKGLQSAWGYDIEVELMVINELQESEASQRRALANQLKPIIAAPPETLTINRKGLHPYQMVNRVLVLAFTNFAIPISLPSQDRRWFCVWSSVGRMPKAESDAMHGWYQSGGFEAIATWMHQRDVSAFAPHQAPAETDYKRSMIENSMSATESALVALIRARKGEFARGVVGSPFQAYGDLLKGQLPDTAKFHANALLHALKEAGWKDLGRVSSTDYNTKKNIWAAPEVARKNSKSDLRRMVENEGGKDDNVVDFTAKLR